MCVVNEIRSALDRRQGTVIAMIDLSAAFDTIDHSILLAARLQRRYGIDGVALRSVASRRSRGPIDNILFWGPLWPVANHSMSFRIVRVFQRFE